MNLSYNQAVTYVLIDRPSCHLCSAVFDHTRIITLGSKAAIAGWTCLHQLVKLDTSKLPLREPLSVSLHYEERHFELLLSTGGFKTMLPRTGRL